MAYMIYQQLTTAVKDAYAGDADIESLYVQAQSCRRFLESLQIDPNLSGPVVEPVTYIEEAFKSLLETKGKNK